MNTFDPRLVDAFYDAALFQIDQIEHHGWGKFTSNFLREYARAKYKLRFSNSLSPRIFDEVIRQHPHLGEWIKTKHKKEAGGGGEFDLWAFISKGPLC